MQYNGRAADRIKNIFMQMIWIESRASERERESERKKGEMLE